MTDCVSDKNVGCIPSAVTDVAYVWRYSLCLPLPPLHLLFFSSSSYHHLCFCFVQVGGEKFLVPLSLLKHAEKVCSNKICILLHHVGVSFNLKTILLHRMSTAARAITRQWNGLMKYRGNLASSYSIRVYPFLANVNLTLLQKT